jgi:hypothetical protein
MVLREILDDVFNTSWKRSVKENPSSNIKRGFIKKIYLSTCIKYYKELQEKNIKVDETNTITFFDTFNYVYYYHLFRVSHLSNDERVLIQKKKDYQNQLISRIARHMVLNENMNVKINKTTAQFSPEIVAYNMTINLMLDVLRNIVGNDLRMSGLKSLFINSCVTMKSIINLLADGHEMDAIILWRHLFEMECLLKTLNKYDDNVFASYYAHQKYLDIEDDKGKINEEIDREIIESMEKFSVNKNERYSFINYGWMFSIDEFKDNYKKKYKLSFKSGLVKITSLEDGYDAYANASKITHPSGLTLTVSKSSFYLFAMRQLRFSILNIINIVEKYFDQYKNSVKYEYYLNQFLRTKGDYIFIINENHKILEDKHKL